MAEQGYRRGARRSTRKRVGTYSCLAKEGRAVCNLIRTQDLSDRASVLTEPFDNSVAHASCSLRRTRQLSITILCWWGVGRVLSPSDAQRQYDEVKRALGFFLFPIIPV